MKTMIMTQKFLLFWTAVVICGSEETSVDSTGLSATDYQRQTNIQTKLSEVESTIQEIKLRFGQLERQLRENTANLTTVSNALSHLLEKQQNVTKESDQRIKNLELKIDELKNLEETRSSNFLKTNTVPESCLEVKQRGNNVTGTFLIQPKFASDPFLVVCDMTTMGGGWMIFLNRFDGSVDFNQDWQSYKNSFGNFAGEYWLGLEKIYQSSGYELNELLVEVVGPDNKQFYAHYKYFSIGSEQEGYRLKTAGGFSGTAQNALPFFAGGKFVTKDKDQANAAATHKAGWWWLQTGPNGLTGLYQHPSKYLRLRWSGHFNLKKARMLIRPQSDSTFRS